LGSGNTKVPKGGENNSPDNTRIWFQPRSKGITQRPPFTGTTRQELTKRKGKRGILGFKKIEDKQDLNVSRGS